MDFTLRQLLSRAAEVDTKLQTESEFKTQLCLHNFLIQMLGYEYVDTVIKIQAGLEREFIGQLNYWKCNVETAINHICIAMLWE